MFLGAAVLTFKHLVCQLFLRSSEERSSRQPSSKKEKHKSDRDLNPHMFQAHLNLVHQHIDYQTHRRYNMCPPDELLSPCIRSVLLVSLLIAQHNVFVDVVGNALVVYLEPGPACFMCKPLGQPLEVHEVDEVGDCGQGYGLSVEQDTSFPHVGLFLFVVVLYLISLDQLLVDYLLA